MRTITLNRPLDESGVTRRTATVVDSDALAPYHHPHFLRAEPGRWTGQPIWYFKAFTGHENKPQRPADLFANKSLSLDDKTTIADEYKAALMAWSRARLELHAVPLLREAAPLWEAWVAAQGALAGAFQAFRSTPDNRWMSQLLCLADAERAALAAATRWDEAAERLAVIEDDHLREVVYDFEYGLAEAAQAADLDISAWHIDALGAYRHRGYGYRTDVTPLVGVLRDQVGEQRARLREVAGRAGNRNPLI